MSDRELLELAAKAAGIDTKWVRTDYEQTLKTRYVEENMAGWKVWNPLTDDGDALRLAVKLKLNIEGWSRCVETTEQLCGWFHGDFGDDDCAKVRRAIVRAVAEIGKEMK